MSLDLSLNGPEVEVEETCHHCGVTSKVKRSERLWDQNITHNLASMARAAGLYEVLWRPEEYNITKASQAIPILADGLNRLLDNRGKFEAFNPENGWGDYDGLVNFTRSFLTACREYPDALIESSR